ncbi:Bestrophin, RFP-TM, chloride channel-domain-containing protein [Geopyxis carbonaria]|nr:Bestrophin, RFP-TM, chloride channel-domain-containing protein [Geopyxis carbonaria]
MATLEPIKSYPNDGGQINGLAALANHIPSTEVGGSRTSSDGRTLTSMDGPPLHTMPSSRKQTVMPGVNKNSTIDLDDYFSGPVDPAKHSKFPLFMRLHGSILPKLIIPMIFVAAWSTAITYVSQKVHSLKVDSVLLTVLGFVVGLALSFRSSTAYERYGEGRRYWAQLILFSRSLAHIIWIHGKERTDTDEQAKEDLLSKLSAINLILAFAQSCKHKLRHEIEYDYTDLKPLIDHLDTFAKRASVTDRSPSTHNRSLLQASTWGEYLGIPFATANPQRAYKLAARAGRHHGNLPYELINYLGQYIHAAMDSTFDSPTMQGQVYGAFNNLLDAYGGCERVLQTPLPIAYNIAISQITWLYVLVLPFQLTANLGWIAIPGTVVAAYIILGLAAIGREIEDPFGRDVNDLDLDGYCRSLQYDLNVLTSRPAHPPPTDWMACDFNRPLWPYSVSGYQAWKGRSVKEIRVALANKVNHQAVQAEAEAEAVTSSARVEVGRKADV